MCNYLKITHTYGIISAFKFTPIRAGINYNPFCTTFTVSTFYAYSQLDFFAICDDLQKSTATLDLGQHHRESICGEYALVLYLAVVRGTERRDAVE